MICTFHNWGLWIGLHITALLQAIIQPSLCNTSCGIFPFTPTGTFFPLLLASAFSLKRNIAVQAEHTPLPPHWGMPVPSAWPCSVGVCREGIAQNTTEISQTTSFGLVSSCCWGWTPCGAPLPTAPSSTALGLCCCLAVTHLQVL